MVDTLQDFPQARRVSPDILRRLRELDETATVVHLGGPTWCVGKVRPNGAVRDAAVAMLDNWMGKLIQGAKMTAQGRSRVQFALLALRGFRPVELYDVRNDMQFERMVDDFRRSRWLWLHTSDNEMWRRMDQIGEQKKAENEAQLTDPNAAKDAWSYAFTRSHSMAVNLTPKTPLRSGFRRTLSIS